MATVFIAEFSKLFTEANGPGQMGQCPPITQQTIAITASSAPSSAFNSATRCIRVHTDAICSIAFGAAPTATATTMRMAANQTEYFGVQAGDKIAVITNS